MLMKYHNFGKDGVSVKYFLNSPQNICCEYSLEVLQRGTSNEYPQYVFVEKYRQEKYQYFLAEKSALSGAMKTWTSIDFFKLLTAFCSHHS